MQSSKCGVQKSLKKFKMFKKVWKVKKLKSWKVKKLKSWKLKSEKEDKKGCRVDVLILLMILKWGTLCFAHINSCLWSTPGHFFGCTDHFIQLDYMQGYLS